jgi:hypothetical protein
MNVHFTNWTQDTSVQPVPLSWGQRLAAVIATHRENVRAVEHMRAEWRAVMAGRKELPPQLWRDLGLRF